MRTLRLPELNNFLRLHRWSVAIAGPVSQSDSKLVPVTI